MLTMLWSFLMPFILALTCTAALSGRLFADGAARAAIYRAGEVILSEKELERARENRATRYVMDLIPRLQNLLDLEALIIRDMRNMLALMGSKKRAERVLAGYVLYGLAGALPIMTVPLLTGYAGYLVIYPVAVCVLVYQRITGLRRAYGQWQRQMIKELPALIDKLRIGFASGRDYLSVFIQARNGSEPPLRSLLDKLINDLQYLRPDQALDLFAASFKMPVVTKFSSAVKIAVEHGYEAAENYFRIIENDIVEVRRIAIEELTRAKPEKVYRLYLVMITLAIGALILKGWEIFSQVNEIM